MATAAHQALENTGGGGSRLAASPEGAETSQAATFPGTGQDGMPVVPGMVPPAAPLETGSDQWRIQDEIKEGAK